MSGPATLWSSGLDIALTDAALHRAPGPGAPHRTGSGRRLSRAPSGGRHAAGPENPNIASNPAEVRRGSLVQPRRTSHRQPPARPIVRRASISSLASTAAAAAPEPPRAPEFFPELIVLLKACTYVLRRNVMTNDDNRFSGATEELRCCRFSKHVPAEAVVNRVALTAWSVRSSCQCARLQPSDKPSSIVAGHCRYCFAMPCRAWQILALDGTDTLLPKAPWVLETQPTTKRRACRSASTD